MLYLSVRALAVDQGPVYSLNSHARILEVTVTPIQQSNLKVLFLVQAFLIMNLLLVLAGGHFSNASVITAISSFGKGFWLDPFVKKPRIGVLLSSSQQERLNVAREVLLRFIRAQGAEVYLGDSKNSEVEESKEIAHLLSLGIDALILHPVYGGKTSQSLQKVLQKKIPVIAFEKFIAQFPLSAWVTPDNVKIGELQAEAAVQYSKGAGNYVLLMGQAGSSQAEARAGGVLQFLKTFSQVHVGMMRYHDQGSVEDAQQTVTEALNRFSDNVNAIIANDPNLAQGAIDVLESRQLLGKIFVAGADMSFTGVEDIRLDKKQFDVVVSIQEMAKKAAQAALNLANHQDIAYDRLMDNGYGEIKVIYSAVKPVGLASLPKNPMDLWND